MTDRDRARLLTVVLAVARKLQVPHLTEAEDWFDLADDLDRAMKLARAEGNRLAGVKART